MRPIKENLSAAQVCEELKNFEQKQIDSKVNEIINEVYYYSGRACVIWPHSRSGYYDDKYRNYYEKDEALHTFYYETKPEIFETLIKLGYKIETEMNEEVVKHKKIVIKPAKKLFNYFVLSEEVCEYKEVKELMARVYVSACCGEENKREYGPSEGHGEGR